MRDEQFWSIVNEALPESTISNFVMICEVHDSDSPELKLVTSSLVTPWLAEGMLRFAMGMIESMREGES